MTSPDVAATHTTWFTLNPYGPRIEHTPRIAPRLWHQVNRGP